MVSFRETSVDDPAAQVLLSEYFAMRAATFPVDLGSYHAAFPRAEHFVPPAGVFLVVEEDGEDVGCGGIRRIEAPTDGSTWFEIKHLWIRPGMQGRGLGRALLTELERRAIAFGASDAVLDTNASLENAGNLYRSSGYLTIEPYNDNPNATHWYRKPLASAR